jgi:hypothetical protein
VSSRSSERRLPAKDHCSGLRAVQNLDVEQASVKYKEIAWLYKTCYNTCFDAIKVWEDKEGLIEMLDIVVGVSVTSFLTLKLKPKDFRS